MRHNKSKTRNQKGALGSVLFLGVVFICMMITVIAIDLGHVVAVKHELQNACDAAAIAGAQDLSSDPGSCETHAYAVANANLADGWAVSNSSTPVEVLVEVNHGAGANTSIGTVRCTAEMTLNNMLGPLVGATTSTVRATALAGGFGSLVETGGGNLFPLALSIDANTSKNNQYTTPLNQFDVGDTYTIVLNSQNNDNAWWTSFNEPHTNNQWVQNAIDQYLGLDPKNPVTIGPVAAGDDISLNNGVFQKLSSDQLAALYNQETVYMAVVEGQFTQNGQQNVLPVVGFIGVQVTNVTKGKNGAVSTMTVVIQKPITTGLDGILPSTTTAQSDAAIASMNPVVCKLLE